MHSPTPLRSGLFVMLIEQSPLGGSPGPLVGGEEWTTAKDPVGEQGSLLQVLFRGPVTAGSKDTEPSLEAGELFPGRLSTSPNFLSPFYSAVFCSPFVVVAVGLL